MSESAPRGPEQQEQLLTAGGQHEITAHTEKAPSLEEVASEQAHQKAESRATVAEQAPTHNAVEAFQANQAAAAAPEPTLITKDTRAANKTRQIKQIQRQLPKPERALSKVIHQPAVRVVSEVAGNTVSRPSGLLGGGLVALIGSIGYLYMTKHIGIPYNYFVFTLLFVGGFALGLILELVVWTLTASRRRSE